MSISPDITHGLVTQLTAELDGQVITPEHPDYDDARTVFYGGFDRRPAAVAKVAHATDVQRVINAVRGTEVPLAVRAGGHSGAGYGVCDGGVVLDVAGLRSLDIDPEQRTAWAGSGLTAGEYTAAVGEYGLATGFGDAPPVGIAGITLGGGVGFLTRKLGLTIDQLLAAEVVTADGELRQVDADTEPDLFWALRGGGGNVGVVTRLKFRLSEISSVVGGMLLLPATPEVVAGVIEAAQEAPEELTAIVNVMKAPPMPFLPAEVHGKLVVSVMPCYAGSAEDGERAIAPFRSVATPLGDMVAPQRYPDLFPREEGPDFHPMMAAHTLFFERVDAGVGEAIIDRLRESSAPMAVSQIRVLGGAVSRVPADATAYAHRDRQLMGSVGAMYLDPAQQAEQEAWVSGLVAELPTVSGAYVNFLEDEGEERVRAAYPGATWDRLARIKAQYDPANLFRLNQNVPPAATSS